MSKKSEMMKSLIETGLMAAVIAFALPELSFAAQTTGTAGGDLGATTQQLATGELKYIPTLISSVCYILGIGMMVAGALKLRQHSENPANTPLSHGLGRLVVGGSIAALPTFTGWVNASTLVSGSALSNSKFSVDFTSP
jgi:hypothetical protein